MPAPSAPAAVSPQPAATNVPGAKPKTSRALVGDRADHLRWIDDTRQFCLVDAEQIDQLVRPSARARVGEGREVQEGVVDESVVGAQPGHAPGDVAGRHHELSDVGVIRWLLVLPPHHFGTVIAGGRAAGELRDPLAVRVEVLDKRLAAHIQPRVEACRRREVLADRADARHLAVERQRRHLARVDAALLDHAADRRARAGVKVLVFLLDHPRLRVENRHVDAGFRDQLAIDVVKSCLGTAGAEINAK